MECKCKSCEPKLWAMLPLRFALGLLFLAMGLSKLFGAGGVGSFASTLYQYGVPLPQFFAVLVPLVEIFGGIFLMLGFLTWLSSLLLSVIIVVVMVRWIVLVYPFDLQQFVFHLVFFAGLLTIMHGGRFMSLDGRCCKLKADRPAAAEAAAAPQQELAVTLPEEKTPFVLTPDTPIATRKAKPKKATKAKKAKKKK